MNGLNETEELRAALRAVVSEADFVLSGGDDPDDRCTDCGLAGIGMLRAVLSNARTLLERTRAPQ